MNLLLESNTTICCPPLLDLGCYWYVNAWYMKNLPMLFYQLWHPILHSQCICSCWKLKHPKWNHIFVLGYIHYHLTSSHHTKYSASSLPWYPTASWNSSTCQQLYHKYSELMNPNIFWWWICCKLQFHYKQKALLQCMERKSFHDHNPNLFVVNMEVWIRRNWCVV